MNIWKGFVSQCNLSYTESESDVLSLFVSGISCAEVLYRVLRYYTGAEILYMVLRYYAGC